MSLGVSVVLALAIVLALFALVFVLAGVESRMFDEVMVSPKVEERPAPVAAAVELPQAA